MKLYGRVAVSDFVGDRIVYRNLIPADPNLPGLETIRQKIRLRTDTVPRKSEFDYANVIVYLLKLARKLDSSKTKIKRLIFIGDTRLLDGTAFINICKAGEWNGIAFIGSENSAATEVNIEPVDGDRSLFLANRWGLLPEFDLFCTENSFPVDENTAVIFDLDKTALGARGRNGHMIDRVRKLAVELTVVQFMDTEFTMEEFNAAYDELNKVEYHEFTADNQDYLAYICLVLSNGILGLDEVKFRVKSGQLKSFRRFIDEVNLRLSSLPPTLKSIHGDIYARVLNGDPTPFKQFRFNEYFSTVNHMGQLQDDSSPDFFVEHEIVVTQEIRTMVEIWRERGALLFCLSDKPDEASFPSPEHTGKGFLPIHKTQTHSIGYG